MLIPEPVAVAGEMDCSDWSGLDSMPILGAGEGNLFFFQSRGTEVG